jgi:hypothetical protein
MGTYMGTINYIAIIILTTFVFINFLFLKNEISKRIKGAD